MADSIQTLLENAVAMLNGQSPSPHLDADVLLAHALNKSRSFLKAWPEHQPEPSQTHHYHTLVERRAQGWPVAYLTGKREFWSREFAVNPSVLIPRPDTELLIELSLNCLAKAPANILDLGTGSGIIAITLAAERPRWTVLATDTNPASLTVAQNNAIALNTANVRFRQSNWFSAINETGFDLIVSNPPYIDASDSHLTTGDVRFEPRLALVSPEHGLYDIALIVSQARNHLKPGGHLLIEHGYNQGDDVKQLFEQSNYHSISTHPDLAGNPRVTAGTWTPT